MQVWNVLHAARWKYRTQKWCKNRHLRTIAQLCRAISLQLRHYRQLEKNLLSSNISPICPYNMLNFGLCWDRFVSLGHPANFDGFRVLAALLHSHSAALNRRRHLYSAGRPSRWALAHISSAIILLSFEVWPSTRHWNLTSHQRVQFHVNVTLIHDIFNYLWHHISIHCIGVPNLVLKEGSWQRSYDVISIFDKAAADVAN